MEPRSRSTNAPQVPVTMYHVFVADGMLWVQIDYHHAWKFLSFSLLLRFNNRYREAKWTEWLTNADIFLFLVLFYLGHLVDVIEAGQLDAQHVGWQPDGAPPPLAHLDEPGPAALAAH